MTIHEDFAPYAGAYVGVPETPYVHGAQKRLLDLALAIPALILLSPLLIVLAILIRAGSKGPALFRQTRLGVN
ncbi:MAG: sugar transferase, partial [Rhizomicrobium sp.]